PVPGNVGLSESQKAARVREIFWPYHNRIEAELDRRRKAGRPAALIAMHSFAPAFMGVTRPWHLGVLYNRDTRFAHLLMALLKREEGLVVGDNEPYGVTDELDYTIPVHGERRGLHHVAIEVRHDLIADGKGQRAWGPLHAHLLPRVYQELVAALALRPACRPINPPSRRCFGILFAFHVDFDLHVQLILHISQVGAGER